MSLGVPLPLLSVGSQSEYTEGLVIRSDGQNAGGTMPWEESPYVPAVPEEE